jgi:hypothetical protein
MTATDAHADLRRYLQDAREAMLWKLDGLSEYDILVRVATETSRHAGHADIIRELIDGEAGLAAASSNLPPGDQAWWQAHRTRVEHAAREAAAGGGN